MSYISFLEGTNTAQESRSTLKRDRKMMMAVIEQNRDSSSDSDNEKPPLSFNQLTTHAKNQKQLREKTERDQEEDYMLDHQEKGAEEEDDDKAFIADQDSSSSGHIQIEEAGEDFIQEVDQEKERRKTERRQPGQVDEASDESSNEEFQLSKKYKEKEESSDDDYSHRRGAVWADEVSEFKLENFLEKANQSQANYIVRHEDDDISVRFDANELAKAMNMHENDNLQSRRFTTQEQRKRRPVTQNIQEFYFGAYNVVEDQKEEPKLTEKKSSNKISNSGSDSKIKQLLGKKSSTKDKKEDKSKSKKEDPKKKSEKKNDQKNQEEQKIKEQIPLFTITHSDGTVQQSQEQIDSTIKIKGDLLDVEKKLENMIVYNKINNRMTYNAYTNSTNSGISLLSKKTLGDKPKVARSNSGSRNNSEERKKKEEEKKKQQQYYQGRTVSASNFDTKKLQQQLKKLPEIKEEDDFIQQYRMEKIEEIKEVEEEIEPVEILEDNLSDEDTQNYKEFQQNIQQQQELLKQQRAQQQQEEQQKQETQQRRKRKKKDNIFEDLINEHYYKLHLETLAVTATQPKVRNFATQMLEVEAQKYVMQQVQEGNLPSMTTLSKSVMIQDADKNSMSNDTDLLKIVDWNERRYTEVAQEQLKQKYQQMSLKSVEIQEIPLKVVSEFTNMEKVTNKLTAEKNYNKSRATCVTLSESTVFIGTSEGTVIMFDIGSEEYYHTFQNKDMLGISVTAIDVHSTKTEYVVFGYAKGQLVLLDITEPNKAIKTIKDHHKNTAIANIKFLDYQGEKQKDQDIAAMQQSNDNEEKNKQMWMFVSVDIEGKVIVNTIKKVVLFHNVSKYIIYEGGKGTNFFFSMAAKFSIPMYSEIDVQAEGPIIALANQDAISVIYIKQNMHCELFHIDRQKSYYSSQENQPKEVKPRLPALSWGYGHTPSHKNKVYQLLGIGWGPLVQIVKLNEIIASKGKMTYDGYHLLQSKKQAEDVDIDESEIYEDPSLNIEQICFLSDNTLLVLTSSHEIRVLWTEYLQPGKYVPKMPNDPNSMPIKVKENPVVDQGSYIHDVSKSLYGISFHQTFRSFNSMMIAVSERGMLKSYQFTWVQSLIDFKNQLSGGTNYYIQVLAKALDFYKGKGKGYLGIHQDQIVRENSMKAELKLLMRDMIMEVVENWNIKQKLMMQEIIPQNQQDSYNRNMYSGLDYQTLIRAAIEFCAEIQDAYFLFYDLFLIFEEFQMEKLFLQELEPLIISGRFSEWILPSDIIQHHILDLYKKQDLSPEQFEKVLINLNLFTCPQSLISDLMSYCQSNFLSTGILYLNAQDTFERKGNASCMRVLQAFYEMYLKAQSHESQDLALLKLYHPNSEFHQQIQKSQTYMGYKLLWIIHLFLNGRTFPNGNLQDANWRNFVFDILQFICDKEILRSLLEIDCELFFQIISLLFLDGKPCEFIKNGKLTQENTQQNISAGSISSKESGRSGRQRFTSVSGNRASNNYVQGLSQSFVSITHQDILKVMHEVLYGEEEDEELSQSNEQLPVEFKLNYLHFTLSVAFKQKIQSLDNKYLLSLLKEMLKISSEYLDFAENMIIRHYSDEREYQSIQGIQRQVLESGKVSQQVEESIIELIKKCEPMEKTMYSQLDSLMTESPFDQVKIYIWEKQDEYFKCLQLFLENKNAKEDYQSQQAKEKVFSWIKQKLEQFAQNLQISSQSEDEEEQKQKHYEQQRQRLVYEQFQREIRDQIGKLLDLDPIMTVQLIDQQFEANHREVIDSLKKYKEYQFLYLDAFFKLKDKQIQDTIKEYSLQSSSASADTSKEYIEYMKLHLKLCCQNKPQQVSQLIEGIARQHFYPFEELLDICTEYNQSEACALLNKKLGRYYESIQQYLQILQEQINFQQLKYELYNAKKQNWDVNVKSDYVNEKLMPLAYKIDQILHKVLSICKKNAKDVDIAKEELIWYETLETVLTTRMNPIIEKKSYCREFFKYRIHMIILELIKFIPFNKFLTKFVTNKEKKVRLYDMREVLMQLFQDSLMEEVILRTITHTIKSTDVQEYRQFNLSLGKGVNCRSIQCLLCKNFFNKQTLSFVQEGSQRKSDIRIFVNCLHTFHLRCVYNFYLQRQQNPLSPSKIKDSSQKAQEQLLQNLESQDCPECTDKLVDIDEHIDQKRKKNQEGEEEEENFEFSARRNRFLEQTEMTLNLHESLRSGMTMRKTQVKKDKWTKKMEEFEKNLLSELDVKF